MKHRLFQPGEVVVLKMIAGEEVITKIHDEAEFAEELAVKKPHVISTNGEAFALIPYIITADEEKVVAINVNTISAIATPLDGVMRAYLERTSGLSIITR